MISIVMVEWLDPVRWLDPRTKCCLIPYLPLILSEFHQYFINLINLQMLKDNKGMILKCMEDLTNDKAEDCVK